MGLRRISREIVLQALYALEFSAGMPEDVLNYLYSENNIPSETRIFIEDLLRQVIQNQQYLDSLISKKALNWNLKRVALLDKLIIRIALAEIYYMDNIPSNVSINEAIELAKKYSTEQSSRFVNGILDAVSKDGVPVK